MTERIHAEKKAHRNAETGNDTVEHDDTVDGTFNERADKLKSDLDDILDEIDDVLEENATDFVAGYVQKGGE